MVPGIGVQEGQTLTFRNRVDNLIDAWKRERILGASFVKVGEVDAHPFLPAFLRYIGEHP